MEVTAWHRPPLCFWSNCSSSPNKHIINIINMSDRNWKFLNVVGDQKYFPYIHTQNTQPNLITSINLSFSHCVFCAKGRRCNKQEAVCLGRRSNWLYCPPPRTVKQQTAASAEWSSFKLAVFTVVNASLFSKHCWEGVGTIKSRSTEPCNQCRKEEELSLL